MGALNNHEKSNLLINGGLGRKPMEKRNIPAPAWDGRSELLKAIRDGMLYVFMHCICTASSQLV